MYTRCFERTTVVNGDDSYEVINLSEYGFEWYVNDVLARTGLVDGLDETIDLLLGEGFVEVV